MKEPEVGGSQKMGAARYEIVRRLGVSELSEVLLAVWHGPCGFRRPVVIKRAVAKWAGDPEIAKILAREAMAYARLSHPSIVRLYDFFEWEGQAAIALEYVDGVSLGRLRAALRGAHDPALRAGIDDLSALYIGYRVFEALASAHAARSTFGEPAAVIHRDVSPGNVLLPWDGYVKLADFGIAKLAGQRAPDGDTRSGLIKGTYGYMAPEQVTGEPVTVRADVYTGCLLVRELLTKQVIFPRGKYAELELLAAMADPKLPPLRLVRPDLPEVLTRALDVGMSVHPDRRTISAAELAVTLRKMIVVEQGRHMLARLLAAARPLLVERVEAITPNATPAAAAPPAPDSLAGLEGQQREKEPSLTDTPAAINSLPPRANRAWLSAAAILLLAAGGVASTLALVELKRDAAAHPPASAFAAPKAEPRPFRRLVEAPTKRIAEAPRTTGAMIIAPTWVNHRVFLDGRVIGESAPEERAFEVRCGWHAVQIGSKGTAQEISVPCGGVTRVSRM